MNPLDAFGSIVASLHRATFDGDHWPAVSALIDEACGLVGNSLAVCEGVGEAARVHFAYLYRRGERRQDLERVYFEGYHADDQRVPRLRRAPDRKLVYVPELYAEAERRTSPMYNEGLPRLGSQNGLNVHFEGPDGLRIFWAAGDPVARGGWQSGQIELIESLLPHIRHFALVRQALAAADGLSVDLAGLLDNTRIGVLHLDRGGRLLAANGPALDILRGGEGLVDRDGTLHAWLPADRDRLQKLLGGALPATGSEPPAGGSMTVRGPAGRVLLLHVSPVGGSGAEFGARRPAALVLLVDPSSRPRVDAARVSEAFGLTASEGRVTALLAEGRPVLEIARLTGYQAGYVRLLLKRVYKKQGVSGQVALVPRVLAVAALPRR